MYCHQPFHNNDLKTNFNCEDLFDKNVSNVVRCRHASWNILDLCFVNESFPLQVPSCGSSGERALVWAFDKLSTENASRMGVLGIPMRSSVVFKKMLPEEKVTADTTTSKSSGGLENFDKRSMNAGVGS